MNNTFWDNQYKKGMWEMLKSEQEVERFKKVANFVKKYSNRGDVLDVGCGEGILQKHLIVDTYRSYLGIDFSCEAINRASSSPLPNVLYECHDMESFTTSSKFDIIIFNESIYYSNHPLDVLEKYKCMLTDEGRIILSLFEDIKNKYVISQIYKRFNPKDYEETKNERGIWHCFVF